MTGIRRTLFPIFILLILSFTLLNSNAFGGSTLIAFFLFCVSTGLFGVLFFGKLFFKAPKSKYEIPAFVKILLVLGLYVIAHEMISGRIGLTHLYWVSCVLFLLSVNVWISYIKKCSSLKEQLTLIHFIHSGIAVVALLESAVVLFQCAGIFPVPNNNFFCTGTWINPNVTAMFLSLSLHSVLILIQRSNQIIRKYGLILMIAFILLAILMLQCRSAYIVTIGVLLIEYRRNIWKLTKDSFKLNLRGLVSVILAYIILQVLVSVFSYKQASAEGRLFIWRNSIDLFLEKPLFGHGFGQFEKEYNRYIILQPNKNNDHVNMPYNDFLELGVEGGLVAIVLWGLFLIGLCMYAIERKTSSYSIFSLIAAFLAIQLTNFGIQAIPVMVLFLLYSGLFRIPHLLVNTPKEDLTEQELSSIKPSRWQKAHAFGLLALSLVIFISSFNLMSAFYENWIISKTKNQYQLMAYRELGKRLYGYPMFHENYGDALLTAGGIPEALQQYKSALKNTSTPGILVKTAFCFRKLKNYDSSESYYLSVEKMQPYKFSHKLSLLNLYQEMGDITKSKLKAYEIKKMIPKVPSLRVEAIKRYADSVLNPLSIRLVKK